MFISVGGEQAAAPVCTIAGLPANIYRPHHSMIPTASFVELRNVTFGYGERVILRDLSLQVPRGKVTALMGASGGGK
ncbi:hypothetical protein ACQ1Z8_17630, partial [Enterococcus faecalis]